MDSVPALAFDAYCISCDGSKMDLVAVHDFLAYHSTWAQNVSYEQVVQAAAHSLNFGLFYQDQQIGYARVVTDYTAIAYLCDVYILEHHRGRGLSSRLLEYMLQHPALQGLRRWLLRTSTAEWLYQKYGFKAIENPEIYYEKTLSTGI